ncbi:MAG TPA: DoxX family protein [Planctomycetota bacterium]|jgi:hypothetical protein|nr:DoxX family protein [Planctomycetota bacterium]
MERSKKVVWAGRIVSGLASLVFAMSATMKLKGGAGPAQMFAHLGLSESLILPIAILELSSLAIYLLPRTSVLGAILLTGLMGGAILSHLRVGEPPVVPSVLGILVWLGLYLRESRLGALLPLRSLAPAEASVKLDGAGSLSPAVGRGNS